MRPRAAVPAGWGRAALFAVAALAGCARNSDVATARPSPLIGLWAEVVTSQPANPVDGRQVIERHADGRFRLVFVKTLASRAPCTGEWRLDPAGLYTMTFATTACFSDGPATPRPGMAFQVALVDAQPSRLRFDVPSGVPMAAWQARLEGGLD